MKRRRPGTPLEQRLLPPNAILDAWHAEDRRRRTRHHWRLIQACHPRYKTAEPERQAIACPFYVPMPGPLGADWGVVLNPGSVRYGLLTFEHADCGCTSHSQPKGTE